MADMLCTYSLALAFASPLSPPKIPDTFTAVVTSTTSGTSSVEPKGKATMKQFCALLRSAPLESPQPSYSSSSPPGARSLPS